MARDGAVVRCRVNLPGNPPVAHGNGRFGVGLGEGGVTDTHRHGHRG
jgi:hypothetical protein